MLFSANSAVEQEVMVTAMVIALFCLHTSDVHQKSFNRSRVRLCVKTPTPEVGLLQTCARVRLAYGTCPNVERLVDVCRL